MSFINHGVMPLRTPPRHEAREDQRSLLGLEKPAAKPPRLYGSMPERPSYPVISSGWEFDDPSTRSGTSDLATALRAGLILVGSMLAAAYLLS